MPESSPQLPLRRALAVLVGLFATWQFVYLPAANLIDFVPRRMSAPDPEPMRDDYQKRGTFTTVEPLQRAADTTGDVLDFWSEVSGQEQGWSLFAPGVPTHTLFVATEFRFADGTSDTVLSQFEPTDRMNPPYRVPLLSTRPFNFEAQFTYQAWFASPEVVEQYPHIYRELPGVVRVWRPQIRAWLAWQLKRYQAAHPERGTPTEVILKHRYIPTPKPGEPRGWTAPPFERSFAHWRPADDSFDAYDPVNKQFVPLGGQP
jgi:hypothetical protein